MYYQYIYTYRVSTSNWTGSTNITFIKPVQYQLKHTSLTAENNNHHQHNTAVGDSWPQLVDGSQLKPESGLFQKPERVECDECLKYAKTFTNFISGHKFFQRMLFKRVFNPKEATGGYAKGSP